LHHDDEWGFFRVHLRGPRWERDCPITVNFRFTMMFCLATGRFIVSVQAAARAAPVLGCPDIGIGGDHVIAAAGAGDALPGAMALLERPRHSDSRP